MSTPALFIFVVGLVILLLASHTLLQLIQAAAAKWQFSPLVISLVVVSLGTSLPELVVTISAVAQHDFGLAMGNIVGSSILNLTLIFGLGILASSIRIGNHKTQINTLIMLTITCLLVGLRLSPLPSLAQAGLLFIGLVLAMSYDYILAIRGRKQEDRRLLSKIIKTQRKRRRYPKLVVLILALASLFGLVVGGLMIVQAVEELAVIWQISTTAIGLTLMALATSMPELVTILLAEHDHEDKVVIGTLIGSNIFNLTLFPSIVLIAQQVKDPVPVIDLFYLLLATVTFVLIVFHYRKRHIPHWVGLGLLLIFFVFTFQTMK